MLELRDLEVCYGSISALQGVSAKVERGNIVTLVGANGAGKTTTLRTVSGVVKARAGKSSSMARRSPIGAPQDCRAWHRASA